MNDNEKLLTDILTDNNIRNISFSDMVNLLLYLGFSLRIKGDHHIFTKHAIKEIINIQPNKNMAKMYQIKQIRNIIIKYKLSKGKSDV